jgi:hypothetical protein
MFENQGAGMARRRASAGLRLAVALWAAVFAAGALAALAADDDADKKKEDEVIEMPEVLVSGSGNEAGVTTLSHEKIQNTPTPTNTITDALRSQSNIQFSSESRSSAAGGEITPPRITIRGSKHYENNFMLGGVSNSNNITPGGGGDGFSFSGEAQTLFIDTSLLDSISVYSENIGAEYGSFTGGVVDAKLRDARTDRWHAAANFRYTSDSLASFHYTEGQQQSVKRFHAQQSEFSKSDFNIAVDGPLTRNLGLLVSYARQHSYVPSDIIFVNADYSEYREKKKTYRDNENFLIRLNTKGYERFEASLTAIYAPYRNSSDATTRRNEGGKTQGGGFSLIYDMTNKFSFASLKTLVNFKHDKFASESDNPNPFVARWITVPGGYANWFEWDDEQTIADEVAYQNQESTKKSFSYKGVLDFNKVRTGGLGHTIKAGVEAEFATAKYEKLQDNVSFTMAILDSAAVGDRLNGVITGEQWTQSRPLYPAGKRTADYKNFAIFLEDAIDVERFTFRPGIRMSYDDITGNFDPAWRLFANADIFNNGKWNVYGGYNRYYGTQILANALGVDNGIKFYRRTNWDAPWEPSFEMFTSSELGDLKTPYSDEVNLGSSVNYRKTLFKLDLVSREYKDQIRGEIDGSQPGIWRHFINTNKGRTSYRGATFTAAKDYAIGDTRHVSELSFTASRTKDNSSVGSNTAWSDWFSGWGDIEYVTFNGAVIPSWELPSVDFAAPFVFTYSHQTQIGENLRLNVILRDQAGERRIFQMGDGLPDPDTGDPTRLMVLRRLNNAFWVDFSAEYDIKIKGSKYTVGADVLNLFTRKNEIGIGSNGVASGYTMGRQLFVNLRYAF